MVAIGVRMITKTLTTKQMHNDLEKIHQVISAKTSVDLSSSNHSSDGVVSMIRLCLRLGMLNSAVNLLENVGWLCQLDPSTKHKEANNQTVDINRLDCMYLVLEELIKNIKQCHQAETLASATRILYITAKLNPAGWQTNY